MSQLAGEGRKLLRSGFLGAAVGLVIAAILLGLIASSNGASSEGLVLPAVVLGPPIVIVGTLVGVFVGASGLRRPPRWSTRGLAVLLILAVLLVVAILTGVVSLG